MKWPCLQLWAAQSKIRDCGVRVVDSKVFTDMEAELRALRCVNTRQDSEVSHASLRECGALMPSKKKIFFFNKPAMVI